MFVCPTVLEFRFYGCYHPCLHINKGGMVSLLTGHFEGKHPQIIFFVLEAVIVSCQNINLDYELLILNV